MNKKKLLKDLRGSKSWAEMAKEYATRFAITGNRTSDAVSAL